MFENLKLFIATDNIFMWVLFFMSIIATFFIFERLFKFRSWHIKIDEFKQGILNNLNNNNTYEVISICDETPSPVAKIISKIIINKNKNPQQIEQTIQANSLAQIALLERNIKLILTIANLAPLIGLLGTIYGLMNIFVVLQLNEISNINLVSQYIFLALATTAVGLVISIPCYGFYNYFVAKIENIVTEIEITISEVLEFLEIQKNNPNKSNKKSEPKTIS